LTGVERDINDDPDISMVLRAINRNYPDINNIDRLLLRRGAKSNLIYNKEQPKFITNSVEMLTMCLHPFQKNNECPVIYNSDLDW
jgi:hypothetical protein